MKKSAHDVIAEWIRQDTQRMQALRIASTLNLNDWFIAAGFVRNLVWDKYHRSSSATPFNDIDLIYFDSSNICESRDKQFEGRLKEIIDLPWSVKNQARMHIRNSVRPYKSSLDAMRYWPEKETAVGVRLNGPEELIIKTPFQLENLLEGKLSRNILCVDKLLFQSRLKTKNWISKWPMLEIEHKK